MLSLLIPTYNYNVYPLVSELNEQCTKCGIDYEIIVLDDASNVVFEDIKKINDFKNCRYLVNENNLSRASNINKLATFSKFNYILILEADSFPSTENYIRLYLNAILTKPEAVFGGVIYAENKPQKKALLRWIYGNRRESKKLFHRQQNPYDIVFSWNLLLKKEVFLQNQFDTSITTYGFEDLVFLKKLKENNVVIQQIENLLIHQNEEDSEIFIEKSKIATSNLLELYKKKVLSASNSSLLKAFELVNEFHLSRIFTCFFTQFENTLLKNLLSEKPSLFLFDLYRLGYFCKQFRLKNKNQ